MSHPGMAMIRDLYASARQEDASIVEQRATLDAAVGDNDAPDDVVVEPVVLGGRPAEWVAPAGVGRERALLYLHGGGYCIGSIKTHRQLVARLAQSADLAVCSLDYRLAPEHVFPAAVDDAVAAYRGLLDAGTAPSSLAIAGDSAGGGLTLATMLALRAAGTPLPAAAVCLSPWTDLTQSADTFESRAAVDPMVTKASLDGMADAYLAGTPATEPLASPRFADLADFPPLMIEVGDAELLLDDAVGLADQARSAGVDATLRVWPELCHVFQVFPPELVPESTESIDAIATFLRAHLA